MSSLLSALREENSIVRHNAHGVAIQVSEASDESGSELFLKLVELASVDDSAEDTIHIDVLLGVYGNQTVDFTMVKKRSLWLPHVP